MKLLKKQKKSFRLGFEEIIITLIVIGAVVAILLWYLHLGEQGDFFLSRLLKK